jgi:hypothetical protein
VQDAGIKIRKEKRVKKVLGKACVSRDYMVGDRRKLLFFFHSSALDKWLE